MKATVNTIAGDGFEMEYAVFGNGPKKLVILPGLSVSSVIPSAGSVASLYSIFAEDYTAYLFDRKKDIHTGYTVFDMADDTAEAMKLLGIGKADIVGASQGGMMALAIAAKHPELVHKLALASTQPGPSGAGVVVVERWQELAKKDDPHELNHDIFSRVYSPAFHEKYGRALKAFEGNGTREELDRFIVLAEAAKTFDIRAGLDRIKCPVFVAGMEEDTVLTSRGVHELSEAFGTEPLIYPGKGHACYDEDRDFPSKIFAFFTEK